MMATRTPTPRPRALAQVEPRRPLPKVCAWCSTPLTPHRARPGEAVSHGICPDCSAHYFPVRPPPEDLGPLLAVATDAGERLARAEGADFPAPPHELPAEAVGRLREILGRAPADLEYRIALGAFAEAYQREAARLGPKGGGA